MPFRQLKSFLKILIGVQYESCNKRATDGRPLKNTKRRLRVEPPFLPRFIRVFNKTLKSVLLGRRIAASGHCR